MDLFERIIDELGRPAFQITGFLSFGLFGDGLLDPYVIERAQLMKQKLSKVILHVNTNGAAYSRSKHLPLFDLVDVLALHLESLDPRIYDFLMQPLRAERVFPKVEQILNDFPSKVFIAVPVSRLNIEERDTIYCHFMERGAYGVFFAPLRGYPETTLGKTVYLLES